MYTTMVHESKMIYAEVYDMVLHRTMGIGSVVSLVQTQSAGGGLPARNQADYGSRQLRQRRRQQAAPERSSPAQLGGCALAFRSRP